MKIWHKHIVLFLALMAAAAGAASAQMAAPAGTADFATLEAVQNAANSKNGPRTVPGRVIPVPRTVSPQLQAAIAGAYRLPNWDADPKSAAEWKALISRLADAGAPARKAARDKLGVTMEPTVIGGVNAFILTPKEIKPENRNRLLFNVHGGGYVYGPGEAGTGEAALMAGIGGFKVIAIDYRMPPDHPYPAAMDDAMAAWKAVVAHAKPAQHGDLRYLDGRRHDARHDSACQGGKPAAAGGDRSRHPVGGPDRDRRHLQNQRVAR